MSVSISFGLDMSECLQHCGQIRQWRMSQPWYSASISSVDQCPLQEQLRRRCGKLRWSSRCWLDLVGGFVSFAFKSVFGWLKHIETTSVANAANDSKRVSNGIDQGLVTVPFWKQLNITFKCLSGDYTPKSPIIGWCFMRTFTRPCWSTRTYVATGCPTDRHPRTATLSMGHQPSLRSTPQLASIQAPGDGVNEPMNQRIEEPMNQWISGSMNQWSNDSTNQATSEPKNQWTNEWVNQWLNDLVSRWNNESMVQWINGAIRRWINETMIQWIKDSVNEWVGDSKNQRIIDSLIQWVNEAMNQWIKESVSPWVNASMDQWTNEGMNEWMDGRATFLCSAASSLSDLFAGCYDKDTSRWCRNYDRITYHGGGHSK